MPNILVLEDEVIIALDLELILSELGFDDVLTASSVDQAMTLLAAYEVGCAILDFNLGTENAEPVIRRLEERGIPFMVMTGYFDRSHLGDGADDWLVLSKPANATAMQQALETLGLAAAGSPDSAADSMAQSRSANGQA